MTDDNHAAEHDQLMSFTLNTTNLPLPKCREVAARDRSSGVSSKLIAESGATATEFAQIEPHLGKLRSLTIAHKVIGRSEAQTGGGK